MSSSSSAELNDRGDGWLQSFEIGTDWRIGNGHSGFVLEKFDKQPGRYVKMPGVDTFLRNVYRCRSGGFYAEGTGA